MRRTRNARETAKPRIETKKKRANQRQPTNQEPVKVNQNARKRSGHGNAAQKPFKICKIMFSNKILTKIVYVEFLTKYCLNFPQKI